MGKSIQPSADSFMLQATNPTWPGRRQSVDTSSGYMIPNSVTSYFLRVKHEAILSPNNAAFGYSSSLQSCVDAYLFGAHRFVCSLRRSRRDSGHTYRSTLWANRR